MSRKYIILALVLVVILTNVIFSACSNNEENIAVWPSGQVKIKGLFYLLDDSSGIAELTANPSGKYSVSSITVPESVTFGGKLYSVTSIGEFAFSGCSALTSITIPNSVTSIGDWAFSGSNLTSITIPNSVTSIGNGCFVYCSSLTSIVVASGNSVYDSRESCNAIIETATNTLVVGCEKSVIPHSVMCIGATAFAGCSNLTSITIPNSVMYIEGMAFQECISLTSITIPNSVTNIYGFAFDGCVNLKEVNMFSPIPPQTDIAIFNSCSSLTTIYVPKGATAAYSIRPWNEYSIIENEMTDIQ